MRRTLKILTENIPNTTQEEIESKILDITALITIPEFNRLVNRLDFARRISPNRLDFDRRSEQMFF